VSVAGFDFYLQRFFEFLIVTTAIAGVYMENYYGAHQHRDNIIYGTARIGMVDYGYPKKSHRVNREKLLEDIFELGIRKVDTSPRYGDAEKLLGEVFRRSDVSVAVNTKIDALNPGDPKSKNLVVDSVVRSLDILGIERLDTVYLHQNSLSIISDGYVHEGLNVIIEKNLAVHIGASLYYNDELSYALSCSLFDTLQIACNIFDRKILDQCLNSISVKRLDCRSILLQGLVANPECCEKLLPNIDQFYDDFVRLTQISTRSGISIAELAYAYIGNLGVLNGVLIGSSDILNIQMAIDSLACSLSSDVMDDIDVIARCNKSYTNPKEWL